MADLTLATPTAAGLGYKDDDPIPTHLRKGYQPGSPILSPEYQRLQDASMTPDQLRLANESGGILGTFGEFKGGTLPAGTGAGDYSGPTLSLASAPSKPTTAPLPQTAALSLASPAGGAQAAPTASPTAGPSLSLAAATAAKPAATATPLTLPSIDRRGAAQSAFDTFAKSTAPAFKATTDETIRHGAALGQLSSGQLRGKLGDVETNRNLQLETEKERLLNNALTLEGEDQYRNLDLQLQQQARGDTLAQQGFQNELSLAGNARADKELAINEAYQAKQISLAERNAALQELNSGRDYELGRGSQEIQKLGLQQSSDQFNQQLGFSKTQAAEQASQFQRQYEQQKAQMQQQHDQFLATLTSQQQRDAADQKFRADQAAADEEYRKQMLYYNAILSGAETTPAPFKSRTTGITVRGQTFPSLGAALAAGAITKQEYDDYVKNGGAP